jgi:hypothetical protein
MTVRRAVTRRGKRGDVILILENGKIAFPRDRDFKPQEGEWYYVEVVEDRDRYAYVRLHRHRYNSVGICPMCESVVDRDKLRSFAERWLSNMLNDERIKRIKETEKSVYAYFDALIADLDGMIERLDRMAEPHRSRVDMCPPGYGVVDSCFADMCRDRKCVELEAAIVQLERVRNELAKRRHGAIRALDYDIIITVKPTGLGRIFVPGI